MKAVVHQILSDLHRLLSIARQEDLLAASRLGSVSQHMKAALEALSQERGSGVVIGPSEEEAALPEEAARSTKVDEHSARGRAHLSAGEVTAERIHDILKNSPRFSSKAAIINFARAMELSVEIRRKEGRTRAIRKVIRAVMQCSDSRKRTILSALLGAPDEQTEGWVSVIRKSR